MTCAGLCACHDSGTYAFPELCCPSCDPQAYDPCARCGEPRYEHERAMTEPCEGFVERPAT